MKKKKAAKRKADVQDLLLKAGTLADNAITSARKNEQQEAIQMLAENRAAQLQREQIRKEEA